MSRVHAHLLALSLGDAHPCDEPGGWPDPAAIETARRRVFEHVTDVAADDLSEYVDEG